MDEKIRFKRLVISQRDLQWGLAVHSVGFQDTAIKGEKDTEKTAKKWVYSEERGRTLYEYQLLYFTRGCGTFSSASMGSRITYKRGSMILLFPSEWYSFTPKKETELYWMGFSGPIIDKQVENGFFSPYLPVFNIRYQNEIVSLYKDAIRIASTEERGCQQLLGSIASNLLGQCYYHSLETKERNNETEEMIGQAKALIDGHFRTIRPEQVANELGMGYSYFRRLFKEYTGISPAKYIQQVRYIETKKILRNTDLSIKDVATEMGYCSYEYFFSAFHNLSGMTPAEYRALSRGFAPEAGIIE